MLIKIFLCGFVYRQLLPVLLKESFAVAMLPIFAVDFPGLCISQDLFFQFRDFCQPAFQRTDLSGQLPVISGALIRNHDKSIVIADVILLEKEQHLRHLPDVKFCGPAFISGTFSAPEFLLNIDKKIERFICPVLLMIPGFSIFRASVSGHLGGEFFLGIVFSKRREPDISFLISSADGRMFSTLAFISGFFKHLQEFIHAGWIPEQKPIHIRADLFPERYTAGIGCPLLS